MSGFLDNCMDRITKRVPRRLLRHRYLKRQAELDFWRSIVCRTRAPLDHLRNAFDALNDNDSITTNCCLFWAPDRALRPLIANTVEEFEAAERETCDLRLRVAEIITGSSSKTSDDEDDHAGDDDGDDDDDDVSVPTTVTAASNNSLVANLADNCSRIVQLSAVKAMTRSELKSGLVHAEAELKRLRSQYESDHARLTLLASQFHDATQQISPPCRRYALYGDAIDAALSQLHTSIVIDTGHQEPSTSASRTGRDDSYQHQVAQTLKEERHQRLREDIAKRYQC